jgi:ATP-dependent Zn protease
MPRRTAAERKHTAYHEAGHAVIARVLTLAAGPATIKPDWEAMEAGHAITASPYEALHQWEHRGKVRGLTAVWHARIITYMAGAEAEIELLGEGGVGDADDRRQIAYMFESMWGLEPEKRETRLRAMTRMLIRRHKAKIERVAEALLAKSKLSAKALDRLVGRSIDDVKVNAPFLLMMHKENEREARSQRGKRARGTAGGC